MNKILLALLGAALIIAACKKDKYSTRPVVTFLSYEPATLDSNTQQLTIKFNVKDGDGDIEDSLYMAPIAGNMKVSDTAYVGYRMPSIEGNRGNNIDAEITVRMANNHFQVWKEDAKKDSFRLKVFVRDRARNVSDTIYTKWTPIYKKKRN